jgi:hypothetical protein
MENVFVGTSLSFVRLGLGHGFRSVMVAKIRTTFRQQRHCRRQRPVALAQAVVEHVIFCFYHFVPARL